MFSKKEDFTNSIQSKIGLRIEDLSSKDYNSIQDLAQLFEAKNKDSNWKPLHFLNTLSLMKKSLESITEQSIDSQTNLNTTLNKSQKQEFLNALQSNNIKPIELSRPKTIHQFVFIFPALSIMGSMLLSTYLITAKDYSGWVYLSGLVSIILSLGLFKLTAGLKVYFKPDTLFEYAKSTYVVRHKQLIKNEITTSLITDFLLEELQHFYKKDFSKTDSIPEN